MRLLNNFSNLSQRYKIISLGVIIVLVLVGYVYFISGDIKEQRKVESFSKSFTEYQKIESDVSVSSLLAIVDYSGDSCEEEQCGKENFFSYLQKAINFDETASYRAKNAKLAIDSYNSFNKLAIELYSEKNDILNSKVSEMIEISSSLKDKENAELTISIAKDTRSLQEAYEKLRIIEYSIFMIQLDFLNKLVSNGGIVPDIDFLKKGGGEITELRKEQDEVFSLIKKLRQEIEDKFSIYKGKNK